mgnify:CR=1 FL=1
MKKKSFLIAQIIAAGCMICACGAGPDGTETASDTKLVSTGYTVENDTMTTENPDSAETTDNIIFSNAALGDVQTENVRLKKSAVIYTKPDANASQLGSLDKGTKVKAIGEADANGWLMIDYNGRAAYVEADRAGVSSAADDTDNVDNDDASTDNNEDNGAAESSGKNKHKKKDNTSDIQNDVDNNEGQGSTTGGDIQQGSEKPEIKPSESEQPKPEEKAPEQTDNKSDNSSENPGTGDSTENKGTDKGEGNPDPGSNDLEGE